MYIERISTKQHSKTAGLLVDRRHRLLTVFGSFLALLALLIFQQANAAPIGVTPTPGSPVIKSNSLRMNYDFTAGVGGTLTIDDFGDGAKQTITWPDDTVNNIVNELGFNPLFFPDILDTSLSLTANYNAGGIFTGGEITITGIVLNSFAGDAYPYFDPLGGAGAAGNCSIAGVCSQGTLLVADLLVGDVNFESGFTGGPDGTGDKIFLEWYMNPTGGDFFNAGWTTGGVARNDFAVTANATVNWGDGATPFSGGHFTGSGPADGHGHTWDPLHNNDASPFLQDFISCDGCDVTVQTFVPVPAAVWLFGSGLIGLVGFGTRNRRNRRNRIKA